MIVFINACVVIAVAMVMLLRDFGPYGIIFTTMSLQLWVFPSFLKGYLLVIFLKLVDPKQGQLITEE
jgi:hypothetical protein